MVLSRLTSSRQSVFTVSPGFPCPCVGRSGGGRGRPLGPVGGRVTSGKYGVRCVPATSRTWGEEVGPLINALWRTQARLWFYHLKRGRRKSAPLWFYQPQYYNWAFSVCFFLLLMYLLFSFACSFLSCFYCRKGYDPDCVHMFLVHN